MREKILWVVVVILGVVLTASRAQSPALGEVGRYQLCLGPGALGDGSARFLYRIDTTTGRTWILGTSTPDADGVRTMTWSAGTIREGAVQRP